MDYFFEDFTVGWQFKSYSRTITEGDNALFCSLVGYHVPLFIDEEYARTTQYGTRICPSSLIMSFSTAMTEMIFRTNVVALVAVNNGRFFKPVKPGDTIRTEVEVLDTRRATEHGVVTFRDSVLNQKDDLVFQIEKVVLIRRKT